MGWLAGRQAMAAAAFMGANIKQLCPAPPTPCHLPPCMQARSGCDQRYLGASAFNCNDARVSLYSSDQGDAHALIKWRVTGP